MSIYINKNTKVITQGITGKTGQFHTRMCRDYANGKEAFVAGVNPKKAGEDFEGIPIFANVTEAAKATGATVSVIYVPPAASLAFMRLRTSSMSRTGMPSVMQIARSKLASTASKIAAAAPAGGT